MNQKITHSKVTLPNLLTAFRIVAAPFLLWLAWQGYANGFLILLGLCFFSDVLDGLVARLTGQTSQFGANLDSGADFTIYLTIAISAWWLWPEIMRDEVFYVAAVIASYVLPALIGLVKFGTFTSYHTWMVKLAAAVTGITIYILFLTESAWLFHIASIICVIAALEEITISLISPRPHSNVRSLLDVINRKKKL